MGQRSLRSLPLATSSTGHMSNLAKPLPPLELLQELFEICAESPSGLCWKKPRAWSLKPGDVAGRKNKTGYWQVTITTDKVKKYLNHRIIYFLQTNEDPGLFHVDHVFGIHDPLNLRLATHSENAANSKKRKSVANKKCSSKFKGVSWFKKQQKWHAHIKFQGKTIHLGFFTNELEAAAAYNEASTKYFGKFAKLNIIEKFK